MDEETARSKREWERETAPAQRREREKRRMDGDVERVEARERGGLPRRPRKEDEGEEHREATATRYWGDLRENEDLGAWRRR